MRKSHPLLRDIDSVSPYRLLSGDSLYDIKAPPMQIEDFLPAGGVMGITSFPGVGKTWVALEVARAVTKGDPFLGRFPVVRGGVLFVGSDSSLFDYARQWTRLTRGDLGASESYEPARFLVQSSFMFEDRDEIRKIIATHRKFEWGPLRDTDQGPTRERGFHVIVFDTLSRLTRAQQNDNTEMEEVFRHVRWIAEATGAACILLHHNSKRSEYNDGADWRGAMSQIGALDSWVHLSPSRKDKYLIGVEYKKFRGITPDGFAYRMSVNDPHVATLTASNEPVTQEQKLKTDTLAQSIQHYIESSPGSRACEVRDALWALFQDDGAFSSLAKFRTAVNNRLETGVQHRVYVKGPNDAGHTGYTVVDAPKPTKTKKKRKEKTP